MELKITKLKKGDATPCVASLPKEISLEASSTVTATVSANDRSFSLLRHQLSEQGFLL